MVLILPADVKIVSGEYGSALASAVSYDPDRPPGDDRRESERKNIVPLLLQSGADVSLKDERGCTALIRACQSFYQDIATLLVENGADPQAIAKE